LQEQDVASQINFFCVQQIYTARSVYTALHAMQTWSSDENSVCLSVRHTRGL